MPRPIITEAASEKSSKPKRGRPSKLADIDLQVVREFWPGLGDRQQREHTYVQVAISILLGEDRKLPDRYEWLCHGETLRVSLLAVLGRMFTDGQANEADVRFLAAELCKQRPNTKAALQRLRTHFDRRCESRRHPEGLAQRIAVAIDDWRAENPDTTDEDVVAALQRNLAAMRSGCDDSSDTITTPKTIGASTTWHGRHVK